MTKEQQERIDDIFDSLPDALGPMGSKYKYINKEVFHSIIDHMISTAIYETKVESLNEFKTIVHETFN